MNTKKKIAQYFKEGLFDEARIFLNDNKNSLSDAEKMECDGDYYFYRRELQSAIAAYEAAITKNPDHLIAKYHYLVGTQEEREQNYVAAFSRYQAAIGIDPEFVDSYVELGGLLVKVGDFEGAVQCFRDAVRLEPSALENHYNLKAVLGRLAQINPARYKDELAASEYSYKKVAEHCKSKPLAASQW